MVFYFLIFFDLLLVRFVVSEIMFSFGVKSALFCWLRDFLLRTTCVILQSTMVKKLIFFLLWIFKVHIIFWRRFFVKICLKNAMFVKIMAVLTLDIFSQYIFKVFSFVFIAQQYQWRFHLISSCMCFLSNYTFKFFLATQEKFDTFY